ncbi:MAG: NADH-quinone oxidoreductase subunit 5 family protein [Candidatus Thorarchaeota archaeon]|jgi:NADH-quinone oxidoreductase subunit L
MLFGLPEWLILVIPLGGSLLVPVVGRFSERLRDWTPAIFMGITMLLCWSLLPDIGHGNPSWHWINIPGVLVVPFGMLLDSLSVLMSILASTLCFLIFVYSTEYMAHEGDRNRFFFLMLAFGGGMLTLVLSNNLLIGFIGWEIMGFCSYGLIGFWNDKRNPPEIDPTGYEQTNPLLQFKTEGAYNSYAGTKAFIVTRIGDAFMLGGILLLFIFTGTFMFENTTIGTTAVTGMAQDNTWWVTLAGFGLLIPVFILIFAGAIGKSGQAPLQVWLPEAMAGPTSVSALIHAATMVKAGVYITARFLLTMVSASGISNGGGGHEIEAAQVFGFEAALTFFIIVAVIGGITAIMTATMGMVSNELKQILAFSTLSQLGYMILSLGVGGLLEANHLHYDHAYLSTVLHVVAHGAFKALLFLSSGAVIHAVHTKYISKMGGLKKHMRKTFIVMWIGVLALAGIPPFSGFWSKDSIIEYTYELAAHWTNPIGWVLFIFAILAAACTIFYSLRLMGITFYGPPQSESHDTEEPDSHEEEEHHDEHHQEPHDPGPAMMVPLYILAAFTIIAFAVFPFIQQIAIQDTNTWDVILTQMIAIKFSPEGLPPFLITLGALALGGIPGYIIYIKNSDKPNTIVGETGFRRKIYNFLKHRWYINEGYHWVLRKFLRFADMWKYRVDDKIIDGIDFKSADAAIAISTKVRWIDDNIVDGFAEGISTQSVRASESGLDGTQTGVINDYVSVVMFGIGLLVILGLIALGVI